MEQIHRPADPETDPGRHRPVKLERVPDGNDCLPHSHLVRVSDLQGIKLFRRGIYFQNRNVRDQIRADYPARVLNPEAKATSSSVEVSTT
jgi:hypothetical protein